MCTPVIRVYTPINTPNTLLNTLYTPSIHPTYALNTPLHGRYWCVLSEETGALNYFNSKQPGEKRVGTLVLHDCEAVGANNLNFKYVREKTRMNREKEETRE